MVDADKAKSVAANVVEKTSDAASKSTDTINSAAYGTNFFPKLLLLFTP